MGVPPSFSAEVFTLFSTSVIVVSARIFARAQLDGVKHLKLDDYLMVIAILPYTAEVVLAYLARVIFHGLANNAMTSQERTALQFNSEEYGWRTNGSKIQVAGWVVYASTLWMIKTSLCASYTRLADRLPIRRLCIRVGFVLLSVTYTVIICVVLLACRPLPQLWQIHPDPGNVCYPATSRLLTLLVLTLNILTDIYLMAIPTQGVRKAQLIRVDKALLVVLLSGGLLVIIAGILRCLLPLMDSTTGPQQAVAWAIRESWLAIVVSNTPVVWAWVRLKMDPAVPAVRRPEGYRNAQSRGRDGMGNGVDGGGWAFASRGMPGDWRDRQTMSGVWSTCEHEGSGGGSGSMKPGITRSIWIESRYQCAPVGNSGDENKSQLEIR